jgi:hypothetical protein
MQHMRRTNMSTSSPAITRRGCGGEIAGHWQTGELTNE